MTDFNQSDRDRLQNLGEAIERARHEKDPMTEAPMTVGQSYSASRLGFEFMGAVLAGIGLGWLIDGAANTSPWGMLIGLFAGFIAGAANAWRTTMGIDRAVGLRPRENDTDGN